jgi:hypothetical protein
MLTTAVAARGENGASWQWLDENIPCKRNKNKTISCSVVPSKVYSAAVVGVEAFEVEIENHAEWGNTDKIALVGLPNTVQALVVLKFLTGKRG